MNMRCRLESTEATIGTYMTNLACDQLNCYAQYSTYLITINEEGT